MKSIGIVGLGFVGKALYEGMKHTFDIYGYDKAKGIFSYKGGSNGDVYTTLSGLQYVVKYADGPIFVCVPTPMKPDGSCDTSIVEDIVNEISHETGLNGKESQVVVIKSTVVPGTTLRLNDLYENIHIVFNPEFLTERNYIEDFKKQDHIIVGGPHEGTAIVKQLYERAYPGIPVTKTSSTIAEMVKYMTNCFLATKVSFANEIKQMCDKLDIDYDKVVEYGVKDKRLGTTHWAVPGPDGKEGFSGSCFPKDLNGLMTLAKQLGVECHTMQGAWETNLKVRPEKDWEQLKGRAVTLPSES